MRTPRAFLRTLVLSALAALPVAPACVGPSRQVDVAALAGVLRPVVERTDAYVASDVGLPKVERMRHAADAERARELMAEETQYVAVEVARWPVERVLDRHDAYVANDPTLTELRVRTYLRSSTLVRSLMEKATGDR